MFLEISHKIHKENTCVIASFSNFIKRDFGRDFFKIDFGTCFPVNFAKFLRTPFSQNTSSIFLSCSLGDCCFFLLIFLSPSFHLFVATYTIGTLYSVSLFYNLTNFVIAVVIFPVFYFFFLKLNLFPALHLCSVLPFCRLSIVRLCY